MGKSIVPARTLTGSIDVRLPTEIYLATGWHVVDDLAGVLMGKLERVPPLALPDDGSEAPFRLRV
jgi:hypothetical protein